MLINLKSLGFCLVTALCIQTTALANTTDSVLPIEHWQTKNKAEVFFVPLAELPIIDINVVFAAGSARDGKDYGLANLTAQMVGQSARAMSADDIAESFDNVAAIFDSSAVRDTTTLHLRSLSRDDLLEPALSTFATVVSEPNFGSDSFKRVKEQALQVILQNQQTPSTVADQALFAAIYPNHPYGHPIVGALETVGKLTPENLLTFYKQYYVGSNATIVIVGNITKEKAQTIANQIIGKLPVGTPAPALPTPQYTATEKNLHINFPASQTYIRIGQLGISRYDKDYFPLYVGNYIFGGGVLVSRLFKEVRESRGLTYDIYSFFLPLQQRGPFMITLQTRNNVTDQAIDIINKQLASFINQGASAEELTAAKQNIIGGFPLKLNSNSAILDQVTNIAFYHLPLNYLDTFRQNIQDVSSESIKQAFTQHVVPAQLVTVTVGKNMASKDTYAKQ
jgi:zinc protease